MLITTEVIKLCQCLLGFTRCWLAMSDLQSIPTHSTLVNVGSAVTLTSQQFITDHSNKDQPVNSQLSHHDYQRYPHGCLHDFDPRLRPVQRSASVQEAHVNIRVSRDRGLSAIYRNEWQTMHSQWRSGQPDWSQYFETKQQQVCAVLWTVQSNVPKCNHEQTEGKVPRYKVAEHLFLKKFTVSVHNRLLCLAIGWWQQWWRHGWCKWHQCHTWWRQAVHGWHRSDSRLPDRQWTWSQWGRRPPSHVNTFTTNQSCAKRMSPGVR